MKEGEFTWKHDGDARARADAATEEPVGDAARRAVQLRVGHAVLSRLAVPEVDVGAVRVAADVRRKNLGQRARLKRGGGVGKHDGANRLARLESARLRRGRAHGIGEIAGRCGLADQPLRQDDPEGPTESEQQLGTAEAVVAQVAIEMAVQLDNEGPTPVGRELEREIAHDFQRAFSRRRRLPAKTSLRAFSSDVHLTDVFLVPRLASSQ